MREQITDDQVLALAEEAMKPADCVVDFEDYRNRLGIAVYGDDGERLTLRNELTRNNFQYRHKLITYLSYVRADVEQLGIKLARWEPELLGNGDHGGD